MTTLRIRRSGVVVVLLSVLTIASGAQAQFTHRIPIQVPKGANGMQPDLALVYDPNSGNGIVGVGWQLAGLSAITRVNYGDGIRYSGTDIYAHSDFGVLIKQPDGTYRSRKESFAKFQPFGMSGDGPTLWKVYDRGGTKYSYGSSAFSVLKGLGTSTRTWALDYVIDPFGNYYEITYINDAANDRLYPDKITYTKGPGLSSSRTVQFLYEENRNDKEPGYYQSTYQRTTKRLQSIEVRTGSELIRRYVLTYQYGTTTGRSQLVSVQEFGKDGGALPAQTFEWQQGGIAFKQTPAIPNAGLAIAGDFNGDGRTDIAALASATATIAVSTSYGSGFNPPVSWAQFTPGDGGFFGRDLGVGDFNGDGKTDIAFTNIYTYTTGRMDNPTTHTGKSLIVLFSSGTSFVTDTKLGLFHAEVVNGVDPFTISVGNFNGDGRTDLLVRYQTNSYTQSITFLSTGSGFSSSVSNGVIFGPVAGDFDGDGKTEFAGQSGSTLYVDRFNGSAWERTTWATNFPLESIIDMVPIDFHGDGKTDIVLVNPSRQVYLYRSTGTTFIRDSAPFTFPYFAAPDSFTIGDLNGDGKTDIITWKYGHTDLFCNISTGSGFNQIVVSGVVNSDFTHGNWKRHLLGDFAGQGRKDLGTTYNGSVNLLVPRADAAGALVPDLMTKVKNGLGGEVSVSYVPAPQFLGAIVPSSTRPGIPNTSPRNLVTAVTTSDGRGRSFKTAYRYYDGRIRSGTIPEHRDLGFYITSSYDEQRYLQTTVTYRQDWPYERLIDYVNTDVSSPFPYGTYATNSKQFEYTQCPTTGVCGSMAQGEGTELVVVSRQIETTYNRGRPQFGYTTALSYDQYANVTGRSEDAADPQLGGSLPNLTVTTTYESDTSLWILGKIKTMTTTSGGTTLSAVENVWDGVKLVGEKKWLNTNNTWPETTMTYDVNGNLKTVTLPATGDGRVRTTTFSYDDDPFRAAPTKVVNALNQATTTTYYTNGLVHTITEPNGAQTAFTYDEFGRKQSMTVTPNGVTTNYSYLQQEPVDPVDPTISTAPFYNQSVTTMDGCVWITKKEYFDGTGFVYYSTREGQKSGLSSCSDIPVEPKVITQYRKDYAGRLALVSKPYYLGEAPLWTKTSYDLDGRVSQVSTPVNLSGWGGQPPGWTTSPLPETMTTQYAYGHNMVWVTDNNNKTTTTHFNPRRQITQVADTIGQTTTYGYDELGHLTSVNLPGNGGVTSFTYDSWGRRSTLTDPQVGSRSVTFTYDALNRVYEQRVVGDPDLSFHFDYDDSSVFGVGRLRRAADRSGVTEFGYTQLGQLAQVSRSVEGGLSQYYKYDNAGRVTELTYPNNAKVAYRYTAGGNLWKVLLDGADVATYSYYDARGRPGKVVYGNHVDTTYGYDLAEHLTSLSTQRDPQPGDPSGTQTAVLQQLTYNWYSGTNTGGINIGEIIDHRSAAEKSAHGVNTDESQVYTYDDLYRLTKAVGVWGTKEFGNFDSVGNPGRFDGLVSRTLAFNGNQVTSGTGLSNVVYDSFGNMQHKELDGVTWDYTWTPENFLQEVRKNGVVTAQMTYDAWGQRAKKVFTGGGSTVTTLYFGKTYEKRTYSSGAAARHTIYIYANGQLIAQATKEGTGATAYNSANRWKGEMAAASLYNGHNLKGAIQKVYHYLNAAALHPQSVRWVILISFLLFVTGVLAMFVTSKLSMTVGQSSYSPALRWASLAVLMVFTLSACGGGGGGISYSSAACQVEDNTLQGPSFGTFFYHRNQINSTTVVTNLDGNEVSRYIYVPFGEMVQANSSGGDPVTRKFTSQERDEETGLDYFNARYYDPTIGRFISADTIIPDAGNAQTYNPYTYVLNNPVKYIDPTGHDVGFSGFEGGAYAQGRAEQADLAARAEYGRTQGAIEQAYRALNTEAFYAQYTDCGICGPLTQPAQATGRRAGAYRGPDIALGLIGVADSGADTGNDCAFHSSHDPEAQAAGVQSQGNPQQDGLGASRGGGGLGHDPISEATRQIVSGYIELAHPSPTDLLSGSQGALLSSQKIGSGLLTVSVNIAPFVLAGVSSEAAGGVATRANHGALLREQLAAEEVAGARMPQAITGYTRHGLNQAISRDGVGVSTRAIMDTFRTPTSITGQSGGRFVLTGSDAVVVVNTEGRVITTWATNSAGFRVVP